MPDKYKKRSPISLAVKEMKIKIIMSYTMYPPERLKLKRLTTPSVDKDMEKLELSLLVGHKMIQPLWKTIWQFLIKLNVHLTT